MELNWVRYEFISIFVMILSINLFATKLYWIIRVFELFETKPQNGIPPQKGKFVLVLYTLSACGYGLGLQ